MGRYEERCRPDNLDGREVLSWRGLDGREVGRSRGPGDQEGTAMS